MEPTSVWVFFYGSYMSLDVLREASYTPGRREPARVPGFDIVIRPRANLVHDDRHSVYGILATATHEELARLYTHARDVLGETYDCLPDISLIDDVVSIEGRASLVPGDAHRDALRNATPNEIPGNQLGGNLPTFGLTGKRF